jgi:sec-independent protein translocase protein TatA
MLGNIGATEIILILLVILIFFGSKKLPEIAKGFGKGIKEFKKEINSISETIEQ